MDENLQKILSILQPPPPKSKAVEVAKATGTWGVALSILVWALSHLATALPAAKPTPADLTLRVAALESAVTGLRADVANLLVSTSPKPEPKKPEPKKPNPPTEARAVSAYFVNAPAMFRLVKASVEAGKVSTGNQFHAALHGYAAVPARILAGVIAPSDDAWDAAAKANVADWCEQIAVAVEAPR